MKRHPSSTILPALRPLTLVLRASSFSLLTTLPFGAVHAQAQVESTHDYAIPAGPLAAVLRWRRCPWTKRLRPKRAC